jgi:putative transposase
LLPDNCKPLRVSIMIATLQWLGVIPLFSRPHVSDDNPYSEALLKHTPAYPHKPFAGIVCSERWVERFVSRYNFEHRYGATRHVTPHQRHCGHETAILCAGAPSICPRYKPREVVLLQDPNWQGGSILLS